MKLNAGILLIFAGFIGMFLSMTSKDISIFVKDIMFFFCFLVVAIGAILNTPLRKHLVEQKGFNDPKPEGWS